VALLGLSFKPGTDDLREAPSLTLASRLSAEGAIVVAHDPVVAREAARAALPEGTEIAATLHDALTGADAALLVTDWPEYRSLLDDGMQSLMARPLLLDGRNLLDPVEAAMAGYEWVGVGRPTHSPGNGWADGATVAASDCETDEFAPMLAG
jgi:UDPglucose 6-dehydrogenase